MKYFDKFWSKLLEIVRRKDIFIVFFALTLSHFVYYPVEYFYPSTGEPPHSWIYDTINGLTMGSMIIAYSYLILRIIFPDIYHYIENNFSQKWKNMSSDARLHYGAWFYFLFILVFLASVAIVS